MMDATVAISYYKEPPGSSNITQVLFGFFN
jgi:hypothetical protein